MCTYFKILFLLAIPLGLMGIMAYCDAQWYTLIMFPLLLHAQCRYMIILTDNLYEQLCKGKNIRTATVLCTITMLLTIVLSLLLPFALSFAFTLLFKLEVVLLVTIFLPLLYCAYHNKELKIRNTYLPGEKFLNHWLSRMHERRRKMLAIVFLMMFITTLFFVFERFGSGIIPSWSLHIIGYMKDVLCILTPLLCIFMYMALLVVYKLPDSIILTVQDSAHMSIMGCAFVVLVCWLMCCF